MNKLYLTIILAFIFFSSVSQTIIIKDSYELKENIEGILIYVKKEKCIDKYDYISEEVGMIKIINTTNIDYNINFKLFLWYDNVCYNCDLNNYEYNYNIMVYKNETIEGCCFEEGCDMLSFFIKNPDNNLYLTNYEFKKIDLKKSINY